MQNVRLDYLLKMEESWSPKKLKGAYAFSSVIFDEDGSDVHTFLFCRYKIETAKNLYLTAGHELAHAFVAHQREKQFSMHGHCFSPVCSEFSEFDSDTGFYNPSRQETDCHSFIYQCMEQRCRKRYQFEREMSTCKCHSTMIRYKPAGEGGVEQNETGDDDECYNYIGSMTTMEAISNTKSLTATANELKFPFKQNGPMCELDPFYFPTAVNVHTLLSHVGRTATSNLFLLDLSAFFVHLHQCSFLLRSSLHLVHIDQILQHIHQTTAVTLLHEHDKNLEVYVPVPLPVFRKASELH